MAESTLDVQVAQVEDVSVVTIIGPVDSVTIDTFESMIKPLIAAKRPKIVVDCTNLNYINSTGIGALSGFRRRCYTGGGRLFLCNPSAKIVRSLDMLGLGRVFKIYATREEALEAMK